MQTIDSGYLRVWYALNADDIYDMKTYMDLQCLEIGNRISKYYSSFVFTSDSLCTVWNAKNPSAQSMPRRLGEGGKKSNYWSEYQYSEYFRSGGELTEYARMPFYMKKADSQYSEPYPLQEWTVSADTLVVNGYLCQKATCSFRGRNFTAWFTMDIPVSNGPWKFGGLPGLILKVYDNDRLYTFECIKVEAFKFAIKMHDYKNYHKIDRDKLLKFQRDINTNYSKTSGAISRSGKKFESTPYEPLELN